MANKYVKGLRNYHIIPDPGTGYATNCGWVFDPNDVLVETTKNKPAWPTCAKCATGEIPDEVKAVIHKGKKVD